jgi:acetyl-CoA synthase
MAEQFETVAEREGDPDLIDRIADGDICTEVEPLVEYLTEKEHPALSMPPIL